VTIDSPFTTEQLDRAEAAWDRLKQNGGEPYEEPGYVDVIQHPYFEEVAKKLLRANAVHLWWGLAPHERAPTNPPYTNSRDQWARGCHVDIQATLEDFEAPPAGCGPNCGSGSTMCLLTVVRCGFFPAVTGR